MASFDSLWRSGQLEGVKKKPTKIEEAKTAYAAKKPAKAAPASQTELAGDAEFRRITDKLFRERKELLSKLAQ